MIENKQVALGILLYKDGFKRRFGQYIQNGKQQVKRIILEAFFLVHQADDRRDQQEYT